jgi:lipopolysaccharide transport system ATP-binding protein
MPARIAAVRLVEPAADLLYRPGEDWELEVEWQTTDPRLEFHLGVGVNRVDGVEVCSFATHLDGLPPQSGDTRYASRLRIPDLPLIKGEFTLYIFLLDEEGLHVYDQRVLPNAFTVHSPSYSFGLVRVDHAWDLNARRVSSVHRSVASGR